MAIHRVQVPYDVDDDVALEQTLRAFEKAGEEIVQIVYFCVAPVARFVIVTRKTGGKATGAARARDGS